MSRALNLTAVLAVTALADLVLYRLAANMFLPSDPGWGLTRVMSELGLFAANLGGVLGLAILVSAMVRALRTDTVFPRSMRITVSAVGLFFVVLAAIGVFSAVVSRSYLAHLQISHAFLSVFIAAGLWQSRVPVRAKLGVSVLAAPGVLQTAAIFVAQRTWAPGLAGQMVRLAEILALAGAALAPLLIAPRPWRGARLAAGLTAGALALIATSFAVGRHFDDVQLLVLYGFRLDLPPLTSLAGRLHAGLLVAAASGASAAAAACLAAGGSARLLGYGLVLLAAAGPQMASSNLALFTLCGLFALALGTICSTRAANPAACASQTTASGSG